MLLNDPLKYRRITFSVPRPLRIDNGDRTALTNAQAVRLRPEDAPPVGETEFLETLLEKIPRSKATCLVAALRFCLIAAQENVAQSVVNTNRCSYASLANSRPLSKCRWRHGAAGNAIRQDATPAECRRTRTTDF